MAHFQFGAILFTGESVPANKIQIYIVLKMASVSGAEDVLDTLDLAAEQQSRNQLENVTQVLQ